MLRRDLAQLKMAPPPVQHRDLPHLQSVSRIVKMAVVESGLLYATGLYSRLKGSCGLVRWGLATTENTVHGALEVAAPVVVVFEKQIHLVDAALCRGLDAVEEGLPAVALAPLKVLVMTKELVNSTFIRPVLKRADSVLESKYTCLAAEKIDTAINIADQYVDQYLPNTASDSPGGGGAEENCHLDGKPVMVHTMCHVNQFSRKLKRRLTQRTLAEAKALQHLSGELLLTLLQLAKLVATDPKAVRHKAVLLWADLSEDEPENQARPASLEGLVAMVTREMARRGVHLVNHASAGLVALPHHVAACAALITDYIVVFTEMLLQTCNLDKSKDQALAQVRDQVVKFQHVVDQINSYIIHILVETNGQNLALCPPGSPLNKMQERCVVSVRYGCAIHCRLVLTVAFSCADRVVRNASSSKRNNCVTSQ